MSDLVGNIGNNTPFWRSEYVYGDDDMPVLMYNKNYTSGGGYPMTLVGEAGDGTDVLVEQFPDNPFLIKSTESDFSVVKSLDIINSSFNYRHIAYGGSQSDVHVLDIDNRKKLIEVSPFGGGTDIHGLRYHHANDWLACSGTGRSEVKILDSSSDYSTIAAINGPNEGNISPAWGDDYLFSVSFTFKAFSSNNVSLVVVDPTDWSTVHTKSIDSETRPKQSSVDRNNGWYAVKTDKGTFIFNTTSPWEKVASVPHSARQVEFSPDGNWLSVGSIVYDTSDWSEAFSPSDAETPVSFGPDSNLVGYCKTVSDTITRIKFFSTGDWTEYSTFDTSSKTVNGESLMFLESLNYE
jgi:hypothetical protein